MDIGVICINICICTRQRGKLITLTAVILMGSFFKISRVNCTDSDFSLAKFYQCDSSKKKSLHNR